MLLLSQICCYSPELSVFSVTKMKSDIVYARAGILVTNNLNDRMKNKQEVIYLIFQEVG